MCSKMVIPFYMPPSVGEFQFFIYASILVLSVFFHLSHSFRNAVVYHCYFILHQTLT